MKNFLTLSYWFAVFPGEISPILNKLLILSEAVFILAAIAIFFLLKRSPKNIYRKIWRRIFGFSIWNAVIGMFVWFFMYEAMPILSSRFWLLVWAAGIGIWVFFIVREALTLPQKKKEFEAELLYKKYIP